MSQGTEIKVERIKMYIGGGIYTANNYNLNHRKDGKIIARKNPRFNVLKRKGGKVKARWKERVDAVREDT